MKRFLGGLLILVAVSAVTIPTTADAGILSRLFGRRTRYVVQTPVAQAQVDEGYRRYSYEPAQPRATYRSYERTREPWHYQKSDPRRSHP